MEDPRNKKTWLGLISKTCRGSHSCLMLPALYWPIRELHLWAPPIRSQDLAKPNRTAWWDRQPPQEQGPTLILWCWDVGWLSRAEGHSTCFASVIHLQCWVVILSQLLLQTIEFTFHLSDFQDCFEMNGNFGYEDKRGSGGGYIFKECLNG